MFYFLHPVRIPDDRKKDSQIERIGDASDDAYTPVADVEAKPVDLGFLE